MIEHQLPYPFVIGAFWFLIAMLWPMLLKNEPHKLFMSYISVVLVAPMGFIMTAIAFNFLRGIIG